MPTATDRKIEEIKAKIFEKKVEPITKRVTIIFDGKQYTIRIPKDFAEKAQINPEKDEFQFILEKSEDRSILPSLQGELIEKR